MKIYEKYYNNDQCNSLGIFLIFPSVSFRRIEKDWLQEEDRITELNFSTYIRYSSSRIYKSFKIRILGFGISITRQTGY